MDFYGKVTHIEQKRDFKILLLSIYFKGRNFCDFPIFGKIRESLFPQNICYL